MKYICPRCSYNTTDKSKYINHLYRRFICKPNLSNNNLEQEYLKYNILNKISSNEPKMSQNEPFLSKIREKNLHEIEKKIDVINNSNIQNIINLLDDKMKNEPKMSQNESIYIKKKEIEIKNSYNCEYCNKNYLHIQSLNKHKKLCKEKQKVDEANDSMKELVYILNKQIEDQKKKMEEQKIEFKKKEQEFKLELEKRNIQIDELIKKAGIQNNTITNNIQNNIKLLGYKDTDISYLTENDIIKCINHNNMCIPHLISMIHLDPKKPENHNLYISNLKNGYIMLYDGNKWNTYNRDNIILELIEDKQTIIEEKIEDWVKKGKEYPELMKKFKRYLNKRENNDILNKIKDEVKLMLYNNRNILNKS